eukprot:2630973-Amphidinium_carterae.1
MPDNRAQFRCKFSCKRTLTAGKDCCMGVSSEWTLSSIIVNIGVPTAILHHLPCLVLNVSKRTIRKAGTPIRSVAKPPTGAAKDQPNEEQE